MAPALLLVPSLLASTARVRALHASAPGSSCPRRCIFVSDDHGEALREWLSAAASESSTTTAFSVLHVDAHNDLNVPTRGFSHTLHASEAMMRAVDLANFQLSAVWARLVSRIIWIRQSDARLEAPCSHLVSSLVLAPSGEFEDEPLSLRDDYDPNHEREYALGFNDENDTVVYAFHELPEHHFGLFEPRTAANALVRALLLNASAYVLDIDLDFFVHGDARPGRSSSNASSAFPLLPDQIRRLEVVLASVALKRPPIAVTLARSSGGYVRVADVPMLEAAVLAMLERVFGQRLCITYAPGVAPVL